MANYTVIIAKNSTSATDITSLVEQFQWKGRKGSSSRSIVVDIIDDDGNLHARSNIDVEEGFQCLIKVNDKEIFRGIVTKSNQNNKKVMSFVAHDNGIYFANNKDTFCYTNKRASDIFLDVCNRFGFEVHDVADTEYVIPELIKKRTTAWDVICDAMSQEYKATGIRHYVLSHEGKVSMITRRESILQWVLETGRNITSYSYDKSIENVRTRIRLLSEEGTVLAETNHPDLESKIGIMQEVEVPDETLSDAQLNELCKTVLGEISTPSRELDLEVLGNTAFCSGIGVFVSIPHLGLSKTFYIDQDTHTFKGNKHTVKLKLTLATDVDSHGHSGGGTQGTSTSIKGIFQSVFTSDNELLQGHVVSTSPLRIRVTGDAKLIISETSLVIPKHLTDYTVPCTIEGSTVTLEFKNSIMQGDIVHLISLQNGKKYYVLDRV